MNWTTEKPTKPGWYWHRNGRGDMWPSVILLRLVDDRLRVRLGDECWPLDSPVIFEGDEWAGPLEPPADA